MFSKINLLTFSAFLATTSQANQPLINFDLLNTLFAGTLSFTGNNLCNGAACPASPASPYNVGGALVIGNSGSGTLMIENGAQITNTLGTIGSGSNSVGTVILSGINSKWTNNGNLQVGLNGIANLSVMGGGELVSSGVSTLGANATGNGLALVTGAGSKWTSNSNFFVGANGMGILNVTDGGVVSSNQFTSIGANLGSQGEVNISGAGSKWTSNSNIFVGASGIGKFSVMDGGVVSSNLFTSIGANSGGEGKVLVSGVGSTWTSNSNFFVGAGGNGKLTIQDGGVVTDTSGRVGDSANSSGTVLVTGSGSKWVNSTQLVVGNLGQASLTIENAGLVSNTTGFIGAAPQGTASATVNGTGSQWNNTQQLQIGTFGGNGALLIENGGLVNTGTFSFIGSQTGGMGSATVTGTGSKWITGQGMVVGSSGGIGELTITDGAEVIVGGLTHLAVSGASTGTLSLAESNGNRGVLVTNQMLRGLGTGAAVNFNGGILRGNNNQNIFIGGFQTGELNIQSEGVFIDSNGFTLRINSGFAGVGDFTKQGLGILTLDAVNTYTGNTIVDEGTLSLGVNGSIATSPMVHLATNTAVLNIAVNSNQTVQNVTGVTGSIISLDGNLAFGTSDSTVFDGSFQGTGNLNKKGTGTLTLTGNSSSFSGSTLISDGVVYINNGGSLANSDLTVASAGTLSGANGAILGKKVTVDGTLIGLGGDSLSMDSLDLHANSTLQITLGNPSGTGLFEITNDLTLDGTLELSTSSGFGVGVYRLMNYGGTLVNHGLDTNNPDLFIQTEIANQVNLINSTGVTLNFWDGSGPYNNSQVNGGTGTWSLVNGNWTDMNGTIDASYKPNNAFAVFEGAAGTVTINNNAGQVSAVGLQFAIDGYNVTGDTLTLVNEATIRVGDGTTLGSLMTATIDAVIQGVDGLSKTDLGTLVLQGINTYTGGTTIHSGVLSVSQDVNLGESSGHLTFNNTSTLQNTAAFTSNRGITLNGTNFFDTVADLTLNGRIDGSGSLNKQGSGTLILNGINTYTGSTIINNGTLSLGNTSSIESSLGVNLASNTAIFDIGANGNQIIQNLTGVAGSIVNLDGNLLFGTTNSTTFEGGIQGSGNLTKQGTGEFVLTSDSSSYTGVMTVTEGTLNVNGQLGGDLSITSGGTLIGNGTVGNLTVAGLISPGNSIGTLNVTGNYIQTANSTYLVEINSQQQADLINVSGSAQVAGAVELLRASGLYFANTTYTILHADGGVSGIYQDIPQFMPYLSFVLNYDANNVYLEVVRSALHFADFANTPNEAATANAVESLGAGNSIYDAVTSLTDTQTAHAFNSLSGEIHASLLSALVEESRYARYAVLNRLQDALSNQDNSYVNQGNRNVSTTSSGWTLWSEGFGSWGDLEGNSNTSKLDRSIGGVFLGADRAVGDVFRLGVIGGYSRSDYQVDSLSSDARSNNYYLGGYAGARLNQWGIRLGGVYTWDDMNMNRTVNFPGFMNSLGSDFDAHTGQIFAETGYSLMVKRLGVEPFAGVAYVNVDNLAWAEQSGAASLRGKGHDDVFYSTLGLREGFVLYEGPKYILSENVLLGWQHAYEGITPQIIQQFISGSSPFLISGVPIAQNALLLNAGVNWENQPQNLSLRLSYIGQIAEQVQDNGIAGIITWRFS